MCSTRVGRRLGAVLAFAVALVAALAMAPCLGAAQAWGDVRKTDMVGNGTVEQRGLPASQCPSVAAEHAIAVDEAGKVYFARSADEAAQIASITKVMTAIVALENAPLDMSITVSQRAAWVGESSASLLEGDVLTLEDALRGLMIPSGNDAAMAIAEAVGAQLPDGAASADDAVRAFVAKMNEKAAELGCESTYFTNPHGLDDGEWAEDPHSTAADLAKIVACAMDDEFFRSTVATEETVIKVRRGGEMADVTLESTDVLLGEYEGACGVKTGFTDLAGACFAGAANRGEGDLYVIVLESSSETQRFEDTKVLFDWVYDHRIDYALANSALTAPMLLNGQNASVPVVAEVSHASWMDKTVKVTFSDPQASVEVFRFDGNVSQDMEFFEVVGSVRAGDVLGRVRFYQANREIAALDLVACEDVAAPGFFDNLSIWWNRLIGAGSVAESRIINDMPLILDKQQLEV